MLAGFSLDLNGILSVSVAAGCSWHIVGFSQDARRIVVLQGFMFVSRFYLELSRSSGARWGSFSCSLDWVVDFGNAKGWGGASPLL